MINVVVNVPGLIAVMTTLGSPDQPRALHVHSDVKFQGLRGLYIGQIKVSIVGEIMNRRQKRVVGIL